MLVVKKEVLEFCLLPVSGMLPQLEDIQSFASIASKVIAASTEGTVSVSALEGSLGMDPKHIAFFFDMISVLNGGTGSAAAQEAASRPANAHDVVIFVFLQLFGRYAQRQETNDVWPSISAQFDRSSLSMSEAASPRASCRHSLSPGSGSKAVRQHAQALAESASQLEAVFVDFFSKYCLNLLLFLCDIQSYVPPANDDALKLMPITQAAFNRLSLVLEAADASMQLGSGQLSNGAAVFKVVEGTDQCACTLGELQQWLYANLVPARVASPLHNGEHAGSRVVTHWRTCSSCCDVVAACKTTVVKNQNDMHGGVLRAVSCQDAAIYALAPIKHAYLVGCTDCVVVLGPVGGFLRIEQCERLQLHTPCVRAVINNCHDCMLHIACNTPPLCIGDNRFVELGPYNTRYSCLRSHMLQAGMRPEPNVWNDFVVVYSARQSGSPRRADSPPHNSFFDAPQSVGIMAPEKLLPFVIPFQGDDAQLCGGPPQKTGSHFKIDSPGSGSSSSTLMPDVFPLPHDYAAALEHKVRIVQTMRHNIRSATLEDSKKHELQSVVQAHFKEWLQSSGYMRQVVDLAKLEREASPHAHVPSNASYSPSSTSHSPTTRQADGR